MQDPAQQEESPPVYGQDEDHHKKFSKNQHNQASHWHQTHGVEEVAGRRFTSLQWTAKDYVSKSQSSKSPSVAAVTPVKPATSASKPAPAAATAASNPIKKETPAPTPNLVKNESVAPSIEKDLRLDQLESYDFDDYFPPEDDETVKIDDRLSLGTITWRPAEYTKHALSAIWSEAEAQDLGRISVAEVKPRSVSRYTTTLNKNEACRPVVRSKDWQLVRNDPVFQDLSKQQRYISISKLKQRRNDRAATPERMAIDDEEGELSAEYTVLDKPRSSLYARPGGRPPSPPPTHDDEDLSPPQHSGPPFAAQQSMTLQPTADQPTAQQSTTAPSVTDQPTPQQSTPQQATPTKDLRARPSPAPSTSSAATVKANAGTGNLPAAVGTAETPSRKKRPAPVETSRSNMIGSAYGTHTTTNEEREAILAKLGVSAKHALPASDQQREAILSRLGVSSTSKPSTPATDEEREDILAKLGVSGPAKPTSKAAASNQQEEILAKLGVSGPAKSSPRVTPSRGQEEMLAKLGVTGSAKPVGSAPSPPVDQGQEDVLAKLGVTGSAKPVGVAPGPTYRSSKEPWVQPQSHQTLPPAADSRRMPEPSEPMRTYPFPPPPPPPPPPPEQQPEPMDTAQAPQERGVPNVFAALGNPYERASSVTSQHTQAGSDFHEDGGSEAGGGGAKVTLSESDGEDAAPKPDINIGKGSLRNRKRSRRQIEADEAAQALDDDGDVIQLQDDNAGSSRGRKKKQTKAPNPPK